MLRSLEPLEIVRNIVESTPTNMNVCKVGNQTSSQDPQAINSRIFVGNLNTFQVTKTDVEKVFQRYGRIAGISMHKGYAFVQFTSPFDARSACLGEDGRSISGQVIDVNMVSEPKPSHGQPKTSASPANNKGAGQKRTHGDAATGDSGEDGAQNVQLDNEGNGYGSNAKHAKTDKSGSGTDSSMVNRRSPLNIGNLKNYDQPDTLICGNCKEMFRNIIDIINHKRHYCKLRFACKCLSIPAALPVLKASGVTFDFEGTNKVQASAEQDSITSMPGKVDISLLCNACSAAFETPWDLMVHAQSAHSMHIYEYTNDDEDEELKITENIDRYSLSSTANDTGATTAMTTYDLGAAHHQSSAQQPFLPTAAQSATTVGNVSN